MCRLLQSLTAHKPDQIISANDVTLGRTVPEVTALKKGDRLLVQLNNSTSFFPCTLFKRSGKRSSKLYQNEWNVKYSNDSVAVLNFDSDVAEWFLLEPSTSDTEVVTFMRTTDHSNPKDVQIKCAKKTGIRSMEISQCL